MQITTPTELIRNSKKIFNLVTQSNEVVIIHRQRGEDMVLMSLKDWNNMAISPSTNRPYNKETQQAIQDAMNGKAEVIENVDDFFNEL